MIARRELLIRIAAISSIAGGLARFHQYGSGVYGWLGYYDFGRVVAFVPQVGRWCWWWR